MRDNSDALVVRFAAAMTELGPWEPGPAVAVAVSGGADSMALALLAHDWTRARGGRVQAFIVDHDLRAGSDAEAALTRARLLSRGIPALVLTIGDLPHGSALAERARAARYRVLAEACREAGLVHLLLGHHALDQAETVMMRSLGSSGARGLAGMAAIFERSGLRLIRPLLAEPPSELRRFLMARPMAWVDDPSNVSLLARRSRLRLRHADPAGARSGTQAILRGAAVAGQARAKAELRIARVLAERASIRPEGFAVLSPGVIEPDALASLVRTIGGLDFPPSVGELARAPRPATIGGVRILPAGRHGPGWLLVREQRAMAAPVPARKGVVWDRRFRLLAEVPSGLTLGPLGSDATRMRDRSDLPDVVLRTLPALRVGNILAGVPHLGYRDPALGLDAIVIFDPPVPLAGAPFVPAPAWKRMRRGCEMGPETLC